MDEPASVIHIRWSDDGRFIRKWDTKPFDGGEPMYSRTFLASPEAVHRAERAVAEVTGVAIGDLIVPAVQIARAALTAAVLDGK